MIKIDLPRINIPSEKENPLSLSGNNKKKLAVVLNRTDLEKEGNSTKLEAVLTAIKYDIKEDINLITLENKSETILSSRVTLNNYKHIICFGRSPKSLGVGFKSLAFHWFKLEDQSFLFLPSLSKVMSDKALKLKLWNLIKNNL